MRAASVAGSSQPSVDVCSSVPVKSFFRALQPPQAMMGLRLAVDSWRVAGGASSMTKYVPSSMSCPSGTAMYRTALAARRSL
ncbi:MAG: hypothetical protein ACXW31_04995 [Thermoanaerobaculia bacterium]